MKKKLGKKKGHRGGSRIPDPQRDPSGEEDRLPGNEDPSSLLLMREMTVNICLTTMIKTVWSIQEPMTTILR